MQKNRTGNYLATAFALATFGLGTVFADEAAINAKIDALQKRVEAQAEQIQKLEAAPSFQGNSETTFGGYGEINYNNYSQDSSLSQMDLRRFVLSLSHRFTDRWSFNGEIEWEHAIASADDEGETEIEQAFLNYQAGANSNLKTGLFLMPFGFINPSHEPPTFYGVERNEVETRIIPSTWREGGIGFNHLTNFGLDTDVGVTTGFDITKFDDASSPLASSHQELQLAKAHDLAVYGALNYKGVPGFNIGGAVFSGNATQGNAAFKEDNTKPDYSGIDARVTLWETHARVQKSGWDLQALYAEGHISEAAKIDQMLDAYNTANSQSLLFVPECFNGWLTQVAYTVWQKGDMSVTPFARYEKYDTQAKMPEGFVSDPTNRDRVFTYGLSFKPHPQIVFKTDYQRYRENRVNDRFNLGMGYMF